MIIVSLVREKMIKKEFSSYDIMHGDAPFLWPSLLSSAEVFGMIKLIGISLLGTMSPLHNNFERLLILSIANLDRPTNSLIIILTVSDVGIVNIYVISQPIPLIFRRINPDGPTTPRWYDGFSGISLWSDIEWFAKNKTSPSRLQDLKIAKSIPDGVCAFVAVFFEVAKVAPAVGLTANHIQSLFESMKQHM